MASLEKLPTGELSGSGTALNMVSTEVSITPYNTSVFLTSPSTHHGSNATRVTYSQMARKLVPSSENATMSVTTFNKSLGLTSNSFGTVTRPGQGHVLTSTAMMEFTPTTAGSGELLTVDDFNPWGSVRHDEAIVMTIFAVVVMMVVVMVIILAHVVLRNRHGYERLPNDRTVLQTPVIFHRYARICRPQVPEDPDERPRDRGFAGVSVPLVQEVTRI